MADSYISDETFEEFKEKPNVICIDYDDQGAEFGEKLVATLGKMGLRVDVLCPPEDIPSILYRIQMPQLFPIDVVPNSSRVLYQKLSQFLAQFAYDNKETYDIAGGKGAIGVMRLFQDFLDGK